MISVRCPASCGEIFQGFVGNQEALISYGIDLYSVVTLEKGKRKTGKNQDKAYHAMEETLDYFDLSPNRLKDYRLTIESDIPRGKGMASSTADVAGAVAATARMLGCILTEEILGEIAARVEPTDSTLFSKLSLFNSRSGIRLKNYGPYPKGRVLILEGEETVDTLKFHRRLWDRKIKAPETNQALEDWENSSDRLSLKKIGKLGTFSARAHQHILPKPGLEQIIQLSTEFGAFGVNTAHSGSVLGVLYDEGTFDKEGFLQKFHQQAISKHYSILRDHQLIPGGLQWLSSSMGKTNEMGKAYVYQRSEGN